MPCTLGIMLSWTTYGMWLRGDARGWVDKGVVYPPDAALREEDRARLRYDPFTFPREQRSRAGELAGAGASSVGAVVHALHVGRWHVHILIGYVPVPLPRIAKALKDQMRRGLGYRRPIWAQGYDHRFCFDSQSLRNRIDYIQRHNLQDGLPRDPWRFIVPLPS